MRSVLATPTDTADMVATDALLVQLTLLADAPAFLPELLHFLQGTATGTPARVHANLSKTGSTFYAYLYFAHRTAVDKASTTALAHALQTQWPTLKHVQVSRLEAVFQAAGASANDTPVFHYVVEMDPESGWMPQLSEWYDTEHMPGLATVPGCVSASRFLNHDHGPLSLACYDLVTEETLGSEPWLAVRGTEWSSRMRPRFTNTVRAMFWRYAAPNLSVS